MITLGDKVLGCGARIAYNCLASDTVTAFQKGLPDRIHALYSLAVAKANNAYPHSIQASLAHGPIFSFLANIQGDTEHSLVDLFGKARAAGLKALNDMALAGDA